MLYGNIERGRGGTLSGQFKRCLDLPAKQWGGRQLKRGGEDTMGSPATIAGAKECGRPRVAVLTENKGAVLLTRMGRS